MYASRPHPNHKRWTTMLRHGRLLLMFLSSLSAFSCEQLFAQGVAAPAQSSTSAGNPAPNGLVVVIENKPQENKLNLRALNNSYINGVALQIRWSDVEPVQGNPDWSKLDQLFAGAESSKKWVQLLIFPGFFSPPWALEGVKTEKFPIQY